MEQPLWHCNIAVSLDGRIARPDGGVDDWLVDEYPVDVFGSAFETFYASVDAIIMGRGTYDVIRRHPAWPYQDKPTIVMTRRPIDDAPAGVEARGGDVSVVAAEMEGRGYRRIWVEGGGQLIRALMAIGKLDILELALIPIILGDGVPLFPPPTAEMKMKLVHCQPGKKSALHLRYERA